MEHEKCGKQSSPKVLFLDLNNFSRYPSIAVGYLASVLRSDDIEVSVLSPFAHGYNGVAREPKVKPWGLIDDKLRYWSATTSPDWVKRIRKKMADRHLPKLAREADEFVQKVQQSLEKSPVDTVVISAYLMYRDVCERICALCESLDIPVIIGGPYFSQPETIQEWINIKGLTAILGGEPEAFFSKFIRCVCNRDDLTGFPGVCTNHHSEFSPIPPLQNLDAVPFPDYDDFPWEYYKKPIVPIITGRGCGWGICQFCSDITSSSGRTYRSRSPQNVLSELAYQASKYGVSSFVFTDLKLNSNKDVWQAIIENMQSIVPDGKWICSVHIGTEKNNGLNTELLKKAAKAGLTRITTGLESGSQRLLNQMKKGTKIEQVSQALRSAHEAGISVRTTMIIGYPGETADDITASADFLNSHAFCIERVMLNRLALVTGTPLHREIEETPSKHSDIQLIDVDHSMAQLSHTFTGALDKHYRRAVRQLLKAVHQINRKELSVNAQQFEGVM